MQSRPPLHTLPSTFEVVPIPRVELLVESENGAVRPRLSVEEGESCRIGSHPSNNLVLDDREVSQFHCKLSFADGTWRVIDLGSRNGTFVDGLRVRDADLPPAPCRLRL